MPPSSPRSRRFVFTINFKDDEYPAVARNQELERLTPILTANCRYAIVGKETGENGTIHLQGYASMNKAYRFAGIKELLGRRAHIEAAKGDEQANYEYCSKDKDFIEIGTRTKQGKRTDLDAIADMVKDGSSLEDIAGAHPSTYIRNYRGIAAYRALQTKDYQHDGVRGIWLYGAPGVGKSHHARQFAADHGTVYIKPQNKWFDGYAGETCIVLDDLDIGHLGHYLKIWADKWACSGEIKGGTVKLQHKYFIVTSNYTPESLWPDDDVMVEAVRRRFKFTRVSGLVEHIAILNSLE